MPVTVKDNGLKRLIRNLRGVKTLRGEAGVFEKGKGGQRHGDSNLRTVDIMAIHEFGAPTAGISKRSVVEAAAREQAGNIRSGLRAGIRDELRGEAGATERAVRNAARQLRLKMQAIIRDPSRPAPPNAPSTVARKGFNNPLLWTRRLHDAFEERFEKQ